MVHGLVLPRDDLDGFLGCDAADDGVVRACLQSGRWRVVGVFHAAHQRSLRPLPQALVRSALSTALGAALLTALYGARGCRYELRRGYLAESDAHQVAFSAALVSFDLSVVLATLRRAPFAAFPFVVWNVLS